MVKYVIFTNEHLPQNVRMYRNQNKFKSHYASTKEEVKKIVEKINKSGFEVTAIKTALGNRVIL